jgi:hypothetical protein
MPDLPDDALESFNEFKSSELGCDQRRLRPVRVLGLDYVFR